MKDIRPILALLDYVGALCNDREQFSAIDELVRYVRKESTLCVKTTSDYFWEDKGVFILHFGAYGSTHVLATGRLDGAMKSASSELSAGHFVEPELPDDYESLSEEAQDRVYNEACEDLTYTDSGYLPSWEWSCTEFESLYDAAQWIYENSRL